MVELPLSVTSLYLVGIVLVFVMAAILHLPEAYCLLHGIWYLWCLPAGFIILLVYSIVNLTDRSWGKLTCAYYVGPIYIRKHIMMGGGGSKRMSRSKIIEGATPLLPSPSGADVYLALDPRGVGGSLGLFPVKDWASCQWQNPILMRAFSVSFVFPASYNK